jgi:hypothetical protein
MKKVRFCLLLLLLPVSLLAQRAVDWADAAVGVAKY